MSKLEQLINVLCPDGVEYKRIDEICTITRGRVMSKDYIRDNQGEYPVYSSQTENNGELGKISTYDFDGEYLTWTTDGANAGSVFYRNGKFSVTNVCGLIKVASNLISTKFLYHILAIKAPKYVNKGMGNPKLMSNVVSRIKIPVPPLEVQSEIGKILDNFTEFTAELTAELTARKQQYEYYANKIFELKNTEYKQLKNIAEIGTGSSNTNEEMENGKYPFFVRSPEVRTKDTYEFDETAIITSGDGVGVGKIFHYIEGKYALHQRAYRIHITSDDVIPKYYYHYMKTTFYDYIMKNAVNSSVTSIRRKMLDEYNVPVPPLEEQQHIVNILDRFDKLCNDISEGLPAEIEARQKQYEYYRDKLLKFKKKEAAENE